MLITVSTTSQSLDKILTKDQKVIAASNNRSSDKLGYYKILIQNLGGQDVYLDFGKEATITEGIKISQNSSFNYDDFSLSDTNLISNGSDNLNVRIILN